MEEVAKRAEHVHGGILIKTRPRMRGERRGRSRRGRKEKKGETGLKGGLGLEIGDAN